mgnify:CR=1 FL=1
MCLNYNLSVKSKNYVNYYFFFKTFLANTARDIITAIEKQKANITSILTAKGIKSTS